MGCGGTKETSPAAKNSNQAVAKAAPPPQDDPVISLSAPVETDLECSFLCVLAPPPSAPGPVAHIVAFDNPLLDIIVPVSDEFLVKWGLSSNGAILAMKEHIPMFSEICEMPGAEKFPGGSGLNSTRVATWRLKAKNTEESSPFGESSSTVHFVGTIAWDHFGDVLLREASFAGVDFSPAYTKDESHKTLPSGTCAVLINGHSRSLVANLGASAVFDPEWIVRDVKIRTSIECSHYVYITGFFLRTTPQSCQDIATCSLGHRYIIFNLSAPFVMEYFTEFVLAFLPLCAVVFGNSDEYLALGQKLGWVGVEDANDAAVLTCVQRLQSFAMTDGCKVLKDDVGGRVAVATAGPNPVVVCDNNGCSYHDVPEVPSEEIVDTNGCGDAFVGGFLSELVLGHADMTKAVRSGLECAGVVIRRSGCSLPNGMESPTSPTTRGFGVKYASRKQSVGSALQSHETNHNNGVVTDDMIATPRSEDLRRSPTAVYRKKMSLSKFRSAAKAVRSPKAKQIRFSHLSPNMSPNHSPREKTASSVGWGPNTVHDANSTPVEV